MKALLAALAGAALLAGPEPARACSCAVQSPSSHLSVATAAFRGEAVTVAEDEDGSIIALFDVAVVYKGDVPQAVSVRTGGAGDTCAVPFTEGGIYVVFASGDAGAWTAHLCGGTTDDRGYIDREGIAPVRDYAGAVPTSPAVPDPAASPRADAPAASPDSRGGPIALAWIAALAAATLLFRVRDGGRSRAGRPSA